MTTTVAIVNDRHGDVHVHRAGCQDLKPSRYPDLISGAWEIQAETLDDVIFEVWGASGVASDTYDAPLDYDSPEYRAHTLATFGLDSVRIFPCVKLQKGQAR